MGHSCILPLNILTPELFCLLLFYIGMMTQVDKLQSMCVCLCVKEALSKDKLVTYMITAFCLFRGIFSSSVAQILCAIYCSDECFAMYRVSQNRCIVMPSLLWAMYQVIIIL